MTSQNQQTEQKRRTSIVDGMSTTYFFLLPEIINSPGIYRTRRGELVEVTEVVMSRIGFCQGHYIESNIPESWLPCGRTFYNLESPNDIVEFVRGPEVSL